MYTSIVLVALTGPVSAEETSAVNSPTWHSDFQTAQQIAVRRRRPLAVFIGRGERGYREVCARGDLSKQASQVLKKKYVCVYVDTRTAEGKELADAFAIKGPGVVLGDAGCEVQAFRHNGDLASKDLTHYLAKYAKPGRAVNKTEYHEPRKAVRPASASRFVAPAVGGGC